MSDEAPDLIWQDDLFGRREEAKLVIGYIESIWDRPSAREDARAFTIAVDAEYGAGKTFFLRRLSRELALTHPVAFVDAWSDDLADEPMTAIAATLKAALNPLLAEPKVASQWSTFMKKGTRVAKIASAGLVKRGLGMLITASAVEAAEEVIEDLSEAAQDAVDDAIKDAAKEMVEGAASAPRKIAADDVLAERIRTFEKGQSAIREMKRSLKGLVETLRDQPLRPPIVVVIDELDRCRPTYAIKLLEEIKHLFDVQGVVFLFGLHGDQLAHSVSGAYGPGFDGKAYLRRFLQRRYSLARPDLQPLVGALFKETGIDPRRVEYPQSYNEVAGTRSVLPVDRLIADYMVAYGLGARDAFEVIDILQTCAVLTGDLPLQLAYLLPLIAGHLKGAPTGTLPPIGKEPKWIYEVYGQNQRTGLSLQQAIECYARAAARSDREMKAAYSDGSADYFDEAAFNARFRGDNNARIGALENYPALLRMVARFRSPKADS